MLWGATLRSPHPSARIRAIDLSAAFAIPGVHAIVTADDVPGRLEYGLEHRDQPVFARDVVRYAGEPIAAVAADHPETARRAVGRDPRRVRTADRRSTIRSRARRAPRSIPTATSFRHVRIRHGDPDAAGAVVVEGIYEVGMQDQAFLGPEAGLAVPDHDGGGVELYISTQWLHVDRDQVAACLGLPLESVRLTLAGVGGAFGGARGRQPAGARLPAGAAHGPAGQDDVRPRGVVLRSRAPPPGAHVVPAHADRDGTLVQGRSAHPARRRRVHVVVARRHRQRELLRGGPVPRAERGRSTVTRCAPTTRRVARCAASAPCRPASPTRRRWTSSPPRSTSIRWSCGCATRSRPATRSSPVRSSAAPRPSPRCSASARPTPAARVRRGATTTSPGPVARAARPGPDDVQRGVGFAVGFKNLMFSEGFDDYSTARVRVENGVVTVHCACAEVGQGFVTLAQQIAREVLGLDEVVLAAADTAVGSAGSTSASRQTWMSGGAVERACRAVLADVCHEHCRARVGVDAATLALVDDRIVSTDGAVDVAMRDAVAGGVFEDDVRVPPRSDPAARRRRPGQRARLVRVRRPPRGGRRRCRARLDPRRRDRDRAGRRAACSTRCKRSGRSKAASRKASASR